MKKIIYLLLAGAVPFISTAQPVIDSAEVYTVGMTFNNAFTEQATPALPGPAGASQNWDFTNVTDSFVLATTIDANGPGQVVFNLGDSIKYYLTNEDSQTVMTGSQISIADLTYTPGVIMVKHPMTYMDNANNAFESYLVPALPGAPNYAGTGTNTVVADAWGTLKTNEGTYNNTLRVKMRHVEVDTSQGAATPPETLTFTTYAWYDNTHRYPLMRIDSIVAEGILPIIITSAFYYTTKPPAINVKNVNKATASGTAHFNSNSIALNAALQQGKEYTASVYNINGQKVFSGSFTATGSNLEQIQANKQFNTGAYIIYVRPTNGVGQAVMVKTIKE